MNKPSVTEGIGFINFAWLDLGLRVMVERFTDEGQAELSFYSVIGSGDSLLHTTRVNLLATTTMNSLAKRLRENSGEIQWHEVLTYITGKTMEIARRGEPAFPVGKKPANLKVEYQLSPILEKNQPTTIYGPGASAKSYLADYIAILVQLNIMGISNNNNCWMPSSGSVLYLDWEASKEDHERRVWLIKNGLKAESEETFLYRFCSQPLINDIRSIQNIISENNIDLVIIDSQMAASGYGPDPAQVANQYYNALRSFKCTSLTLDHVSKEGWKTANLETVGPYGSVVKFNRSRSQFELKKSQEAGDNFIELSLIHRKHNEGKLLKPIGIRINFNENRGGDLDSVTFESCNVADNPELGKTMPLRDRIKAELKHGALSVRDLAGIIDTSEGAIRTQLNRHKSLFCKADETGKTWGLIYNE